MAAFFPSFSACFTWIWLGSRSLTPMVISSPLIRPVGLAPKESQLRSTEFTGNFTEIDRSLPPSKACLRYWLHAEEEGKRVVTSDFVKKFVCYILSVFETYQWGEKKVGSPRNSREGTPGQNLIHVISCNFGFMKLQWYVWFMEGPYWSQERLQKRCKEEVEGANLFEWSLSLSCQKLWKSSDCTRELWHMLKICPKPIQTYPNYIDHISESVCRPKCISLNLILYTHILSFVLSFA